MASRYSLFDRIPAPHPRRNLPLALRTLTLATAVLAATATQAQTTTPATRPNPLDPKASVPTLRYESSLAQYRRLGDDKPIAWREANDTVTRIGGWRAYAREAQQPEPKPATRPIDAKAAPKQDEPAKPAPAGHAGHKTP